MTPEPHIAPSRRRGKGDADEFTNEVQATPAEPTKKLSLAIPVSVHTAEKIGAATRHNTMLAEVIELLRARNGQAPWPDDVVASVLAQMKAESNRWPADVVASAVAQAATEGYQWPATPARTQRPATKRPATKPSA